MNIYEVHYSLKEHTFPVINAIAQNWLRTELSAVPDLISCVSGQDEHALEMSCCAQ